MSNLENRLKIVSFGLALGIATSVAILFLGIVAWLFGWGTDIVNVFGSFYIGYAPSFLGSIIGMIWGFFDGFIGGVIVAWLYNLF